jgi:hypothetical protein
MMRRACVSEPIAISTAEGEQCEIPVGLCWVLERTHWISLSWGGSGGQYQVEFPLRDYLSHVQSGRIHFGTAREQAGSAALSPKPPLRPCGLPAG